MAERLKVFVNREFTATDVVDNKIPLVTTDATTQAVVKTVSTDGINFDPDRLRLVSDGTVLVDGFKPAHGSEIIDSNSSLYYEFNPPIVVPSGECIRKSYIINATRVYTAYNSINYDHDIPLVSNSPYLSDVLWPSRVDTASMSSPAFFIMTDDASRAYYFYYDGNSVTTLYYAYPSVSNGVATISNWNTFNSTSYAYKAVDFENKRIRWYDGTYIRTYDVEGGGYTPAVNASSWSNPSTYSISATHKDVFVYSPYYSYRGFYLYDYTTGQTTSISVSFLIYTLACSYNSAENLYYIYAGDGGQYKIYTWDGSTLQEVYSTNTGSLYIYYIGSAASAGLCAAPDDGCVFAQTNQARASKVKLTSNGLVFVKDMLYDIGGNPLNNAAFYVDSPSGTGTPGMDLYDLKFRVKVSGVEITGG